MRWRSAASSAADGRAVSGAFPSACREVLSGADGFKASPGSKAGARERAPVSRASGDERSNAIERLSPRKCWSDCWGGPIVASSCDADAIAAFSPLPRESDSSPPGEVGAVRTVEGESAARCCWAEARKRRECPPWLNRPENVTRAQDASTAPKRRAPGRGDSSPRI